MKISLIHPSRSRPDQSSKTIHKWLNSAADIHNLELLVSCDKNDPHLAVYKDIYSKTIFKVNPVVTNQNRSAIDAINFAAQLSEGDLLVVVSDDTDCMPGWDKILTEAAEGKKDFLLKTFDGVQKWICTMPVMDRAYYERFGYIYNPAYVHCFSDTHLTHIADLMRRIVWRNDILFPHNHYSTGKTKKDAVNIKNDSTWKQGEATYLKHCRNKFGLGNVNIFDLSPEAHKAGHVQWLKHKLR